MEKCRDCKNYNLDEICEVTGRYANPEGNCEHCKNRDMRDMKECDTGE